MIEQLDPPTANGLAEARHAAALERLRGVLPEAFSDGALDLERLKELIGRESVAGDEKYGLSWSGKRQARAAARAVSLGTLLPKPDDSVSWSDTRNVIIEGDNLEVLKLLQKSYAAAATVIYIDPPYNRGKDLVYKDDYQDGLRAYLQITDQEDAEGNVLSSNPVTSGRFHTAWLNMMLPRLVIAKELLRQDGVLLISIDDNEAANLKLLCDEVMGEENFVAQLIWEKGRKNDAKLFSLGHDYILVYARSTRYLTERRVRWRAAKPGAAEIQAEYLRLRQAHGVDDGAIERGLSEFYAGLPRAHAARKLTRYSHVDSRGVWRDDNMSWPGGDGPDYPVLHPLTGQPCAAPEGGWRYATPEKMQRMIDAGRVEFREDHSQPPIRKTYLVRIGSDENEDPELDDDDSEDPDDEGEVGIQVRGTYFYRSALQASRLMSKLFGRKKVFDSPKDHDVLAELIAYVGSPEKDDLVIDFFAGSGSSGHAVMALNAADGGTRRFILVQVPQPLSLENSEQRAAAEFCGSIGKPANLAEITKERIRRSATVVSAEGVDVGFRSFALGESNFKRWNATSDDFEESLIRAIDPVRADRSELALFFEVLLRRGYPLDAKIVVADIDGFEIYRAGNLVACLATRIDESLVETISSQLTGVADAVVVVRDSAFESDSTKENFAGLLAQRGIAHIISI